jgi:hypothetical protein
MSTAPKTSDPSILRKFELSKKEEDLSKKLFHKKGNTSIVSPGRSISSSKTTKRTDLDPKENTKTTARTGLPPVPDHLVDNFFKEMESQIKQVNNSNQRETIF